MRFRSEVHSHKGSYISVEMPTKSYLFQLIRKIKIKMLTMKSFKRMGDTNLPELPT
jgi:hypothetical protein